MRIDTPTGKMTALASPSTVKPASNQAPPPEQPAASASISLSTDDKITQSIMAGKNLRNMSGWERIDLAQDLFKAGAIDGDEWGILCNQCTPEGATGTPDEIMAMPADLVDYNRGQLAFSRSNDFSNTLTIKYYEKADELCTRLQRFASGSGYSSPRHSGANNSCPFPSSAYSANGPGAVVKPDPLVTQLVNQYRSIASNSRPATNEDVLLGALTSNRTR